MDKINVKLDVSQIENNPYYKDFLDFKNYYKIIFLPGKPIGADRLTTLEIDIIDIITNVYGFSHNVKLGDSLLDNLLFDGLDLVELCLLLEDKYGYYISDEEIDNCTTVKDVVGLISRKMNNG